MERRERAIVIALALVCAASRFLATARSMWEWDEAQFVLGMRDYDVALHHPHPPGFPVYIAVAKLFRLLVASDFRALQAVSLVAGMLVFPAVYLFAREAGFRFATSVSAATLFAFFPNVWFFGGAAFSDVPSIVLVLFAVTFLLRGARSRNDYWIGTFLLAVAIGIRPQNLLVGLIPGIWATVKRRPREIAVALLIGVVVTGAAYGAAVYATGSYEHYVRVVREHADYISRVDSWRSAARPPMWRLIDRFFVKQYQNPLLGVIASLFVILSIIGSIRDRSRPMLTAALAFVPFALFAWAMLDRYSVSRFSIGYQPLFALLLADGIRRAGKSRPWIAAALSAAFVVAFAAYTMPALNVVRTTVSPSVLAAEAVAVNVDARRDVLYVGHTMSKLVDTVVPGMPYRRVIDDRSMPLDAHARAWLLAEVTETKPEGFIFRRERGTLWNIARHHYFEIVLKPIRERPRFLRGWYDVEVSDIHEWRWMSGRSVTLLPPAEGETLLRMHLGVPAESVGKAPEITVTLNGRVVDRFRTNEPYVERTLHVAPAPAGLPNVLELSVDRTVAAAENGERRTLGLRLRGLAWGPA